MTPRPHGLTRYKRGPDEQGAPGGGCRCDACSQANRDYQDRRTRLIAYGRWDVLSDAAGTRRRLQALVRGGWSLGLMSARLGCTRQVLRLTLHRSERVTAATAGAVRELYDELWDQPPPEGTRFEKRAATMARRYARERGWVPPLAWDDDEIDDPAAVPAPGWCPVPADLAAAAAIRADREPRPVTGMSGAIRQAREQAGLSQYRLAAIMGVSRSCVQMWERARRTPDAERWVQLELALGPLGIVREAGPGTEVATREGRAA